jgi:Flp pilus assembly protein TadG
MYVKNNSEKGQAIVYLAVGIIVFLGFVALAIDGGMALADRRHAQNGADSASLAGGAEAALTLESLGIDSSNWSCGAVSPAETNAENTAISRAAANNFSIDRDASDHNDVNAICSSTTYYSNDGTVWFVDHYIDVTTEISATTQSNFLQLVFPKALHSEVDAVTRVRPRQPTAFGNAIVALNPEGCSGHGNGGIVYGSSDIKLTGGGIFSNGCLRGNGQPTVVITDGLPLGNELLPGNADWNPGPEEVNFQIPLSNYDITRPNCSDSRAHNVSASSLPTELDPGLWCITGELRFQGSHNTLHSKPGGVTLYLINGGFIANGNADIQLSAPGDDPDPSPAIPGLLIYLPPTNTNPVQLNGNENSFYEGLILASRSTISMNGTGYSTYRGQVIGWNVEIGGTADTVDIYNPDEGYHTPTAIELAK